MGHVEEFDIGWFALCHGGPLLLLPVSGGKLCGIVAESAQSMGAAGQKPESEGTISDGVTDTHAEPHVNGTSESSCLAPQGALEENPNAPDAESGEEESEEKSDAKTS